MKRDLFVLVGIVLISSFQAPHARADWRIEVKKDKMTDDRSVLIETKSKNAVFAKAKAGLGIIYRCAEPATPEVLLAHPWPVGEGPVAIRVDKRPARRFYSERTGDTKGFRIGDSSSETDSPAAVIEELAKGKRAVLQYEDAGKNLITAEFEIGGLSRLTSKVEAQCKKP